jgi:2-C-methyl-D-erythritol 4-phosphate cytidylyltransferase
MSNDFSIIVPAAGKGLRMGKALPKQYLDLNGAPILQLTLQRLWKLRPRHLCLVVSKDDDDWSALPAAADCIIANGGDTRADSVLAGLLALKLPAEKMVLVHDAVRPLFRLEDVQRLINEVGTSLHGGLLATPVVDTLKQASPGQSIVSTVDRSQLWQAQTPQMFPAGLLQQALESARKTGLAITDEASAMEAIGYQPRLVQGSRDNIKITTPEDLAFASFLIEQGILADQQVGAT